MPIPIDEALRQIRGAWSSNGDYLDDVKQRLTSARPIRSTVVVCERRKTRTIFYDTNHVRGPALRLSGETSSGAACRYAVVRRFVLMSLNTRAT